MAAAWTEAHVRRVFWRAGFGATDKEAAGFAKAGRNTTLDYLLNGPKGGGPALVGPKPHKEGKALDPQNEWGDNVLWWLDRMIRTRRPLQEKMTLFWHDHFATSDQDTPLMLRQNHLFRRHALGSFRTAAAGRGRRPGDAAVPVDRRLRQGLAERELRARALRALRARQGLHGGRHPPGRPRVHRLRSPTATTPAFSASRSSASATTPASSASSASAGASTRRTSWTWCWPIPGTLRS